MTTFALLWMLIRWAFRTPNKGGLRDAGPGKARAILEGILSGCSFGADWQLKLRYNQDWTPSYPRREPSKPDLGLPVTSMVDVASIVAAVPDQLRLMSAAVPVPSTMAVETV